MSKPLLIGPPMWAEEGMKIWLPWNAEKRSALRCTVTCAAGNHVRIFNEEYNVDKWISLDNLWIEKDDVRGYDNQKNYYKI